MYTIIVIVNVSSPYSSNMNIDCLIKLNNNVNGQLTLELRKLMEETTPVFWVDLGYMLRSRNKGSTVGFPGMTGIHLILLLLST